MNYANKFLMARGQDCIIERTPHISTKVSIKRSTKASRDLGIREGYWEGLIPADVNLLSGEIISIRDDRYIIQSTNFDHASMQTAFFSAKCNATIQHKRYVDGVDDNFNPIQEWQDLNDDVACYGEIVTYRLRQEDPGLLDSTKYTFQVPKSLEVALLDRFVYECGNFEVVSIDSTGLFGVDRCQLAQDTRPD